MIKEFKLIQNEHCHPTLQVVRTIKNNNHLITTSEIVNMMNKYYMLNKCTQEYVYLLCFNTNQDLLAIFEISHGSSTKSIVSVKEVITSVILSGAENIILIHNHPNGNLNVSNDDINITNTLKYTLCPIEIKLLDHIIISKNGYTSMTYSKYI